MDDYELYFNDETFFRNRDGVLVGSRNPMLTELPVSYKIVQNSERKRFHGNFTNLRLLLLEFNLISDL